MKGKIDSRSGFTIQPQWLRGTYAKHTADSAALGGVWALAIQDTEKPRRRMAGGVPRPLVRARARARNCSPHHCLQQIHFCKMTILQRCQHFLNKG